MDQMANTLKVAVIGIRAFPADFAGTSGVEHYVEQVIRCSQSQKLAVRWLLYVRDLYQKKVLVKSAVKVQKIFSPRSKILEALVSSLIASLQCLTDGSDTVWYQGVGPAFWAFLPWITGKKVVVTVHGYDWERKKWEGLEKWLFWLSTKIVFLMPYTFCSVSREMRVRLKKEFGINSIVTLPGINPMPSSAKVSHMAKKYKLKKNNYFLSLSRLVPEKNIEWIADAFLENAKKLRGKKLVIVGSHGNFPEYEISLKKQYSGPNVIFTGHVSDKEKYELISQCGGYIMASESEGGNPLSFLEALSYGKRCLVPTQSVTSNFGKLPDVFFFRKSDKKNFMDNFIRFVKGGSRNSITRSKEILIFLSQYSWHRTTDKYFKLFTCT